LLVKFAAFYRNLNLGRPPAPTRAQFEQAFRFAGAQDPRSFLTNGTLVFGATGPRKAEQVLSAACANLAAVTGLREPAFLRDLSYLAGLVARDPFAHIDRSIVYECCVTFLPARFAGKAERPQRNASGNVEVVAYTEAELLSVARKLGKSPGSPNAFAERAFQVQATTRAWNTLVRLVARDA
jgi:uncharacterized protein (DUF1697 family)